MDAEKFDPLAADALLAQISRKRVKEEAEENGPTSMYSRLMSTPIHYCMTSISEQLR